MHGFEPPVCDLTALYRDLHQPIYGFALRRLGDPDAARDLLQDVFLRAHQHLPSLRNTAQASAWIWSIAHHALADRARRQRPTLELDPEWPQPVPTDADLARSRLLESVPQCIDCLPPLYRDALRLTVLDGLDQNELAARLGLSRSGARSRVQRARALLARLYRTQCGDEIAACGIELLTWSER